MGSFSILNNIAAINGQNQLNVNNVNMSRTLNRLSSGKRINTGADDAAGLQIADSLRANVQALNQASRNANDGISLLQIADGALQEITTILTRCVTLAEEAATETVDAGGRSALNQEFSLLRDEIQRISLATNFNGGLLFNGNIAGGGDANLDVFVGDISNANILGASTISVTIGAINIAAFGDNAVDLTALNLETPATGGDLTTSGAAQALIDLKDVLNTVSTMRGSIGAGMNRLQAAVSVISTQSTNTLSAESSVRDANIAEEISNMTKYQILAQSGIAALAQANSNSQTVLSLLQ
ncbi:MAG: flagellin [Acidobacteriota bacterium]|jgi:flagellin|nr:flagellin [Acidobacteriota bacterium]